jgi:hypothetical protein
MTIRAESLTAACFLNVDLDIYSRSDLGPLVTALGDKVLVLYLGRVKRTYAAHLELARARPTITADATMRGLCALIEALPKAERRLWNTAKVRDFSIGVQAAPAPNPFDLALSAETVKAVSRLDARIVFTLYPPRGDLRMEEEEAAPTNAITKPAG